MPKGCLYAFTVQFCVTWLNFLPYTFCGCEADVSLYTLLISLPTCSDMWTLCVSHFH